MFDFLKVRVANLDSKLKEMQAYVRELENDKSELLEEIKDSKITIASQKEEIAFLRGQLEILKKDSK